MNKNDKNCHRMKNRGAHLQLDKENCKTHAAHKHGGETLKAFHLR